MNAYNTTKHNIYKRIDKNILTAIGFPQHRVDETSWGSVMKVQSGKLKLTSVMD